MEIQKCCNCNNATVCFFVDCLNLVNDKSHALRLLLETDAIAATGDINILDASLRQVVHFSDLHPLAAKDEFTEKGRMQVIKFKQKI